MSEYVKVEPTGKVEAEDDEARQRLGVRAGRYYLTTTAPDLLLMVRSPPAGGVAPNPRVVVAGDISGLPLVELVGFIQQSRRTGVLRVLSPSGERAIAFRDGEVRGAVSSDPRERLGEIAVRLGFVDRKTIEKIVANAGSTQLGRQLVDKGAMKPHDLWKCLQQQVSEIFHGMLLSREGAFVIVDQPVEDRGQALALNTQGLLMDAIRRIDEMAEFRKRLPSDDAFLVPIQPPGPELEAEERRVFELCSGSLTLSDVARAAKLPEFEALKIVYHLVEGRYVAPVQTAAPQAGFGDRSVADVAKSFNEVFREIRNAVARLGVAAEFMEAGNSAIPSQSDAAQKLFDGHAFKTDGTMDAKRVVENAKTARLDANEVHSALSEVMFFLLFQAGELLDPKADEELAKRVKAILAKTE